MRKFMEGKISAIAFLTGFGTILTVIWYFGAFKSNPPDFGGGDEQF